MPVRPTRVRRLRARKAMGNALLASVVLVGGLTYVAIQKTVTLVVDQGRPEAVRTMSASVGELLDAQGILVGYGDLVTPPTQTSLADGMTVFVERGWLDGITAPGPDDVGVWVMEGATAPHQMLAARSGEDWFSAGDPAGWSQVVSASVVVKGKDHDVITNAGTVRELLSAMGITSDRDDRVLPSPRTPITEGMRVRYDAIAFRTRDVRVPIPYTTFTRYSDTLSPGAVRVDRAGVDGVMVERTRIKFVNGKAVATGCFRGRSCRRRSRPGAWSVARPARTAHRAARPAGTRSLRATGSPRPTRGSRSVRWSPSRTSRTARPFRW